MKQLPVISDNSLALNLLQGLSHEHNINNTEKLLNDIYNSIYDIKKNPQRLHGIRIEKMFGYIAAILGQCHFIKQEDIGFSYVTTETVAPDYRLILKDGAEFFVEVKNCHKGSKAAVKLDESYIHKILNYPGLTLDNFKIAIYWSKWSIWTLISLKEFKKENNKYIIKIEDALIRNEMRLLGDIYFMGVSPLKIEFITDLPKATEINDLGEGDFTIKDIKIHTGKGLVAKDTNESKIIFDLIMYGLNDCWNEQNYVELNNNKIEKIIFEYVPYNANQKQAILGSLSNVVKNKYNLFTVKSGMINRLQAKYKEELVDFYLKIEPERLRHLIILKKKLV